MNDELKLLEELEQEDDDLTEEELEEILKVIKEYENERTYTDEEMAKELNLDNKTIPWEKIEKELDL